MEEGVTPKKCQVYQLSHIVQDSEFNYTIKENRPMSFTNNIQVIAANSANQDAYNAIDTTNQLLVRFNEENNSLSIPRTKEDTSMSGVSLHTDGASYEVPISGALGNIIDFNGNGQVASYGPYGKVVRANYSKVIGMSITVHMTKEEIELINSEMKKAGAKAVDVLVNASPLNVWLQTNTESGSRQYTAKVFAQVVSVQPKALDITTTTVDLNNVDGDAVRQQQAERRIQSNLTKRQAKQGVVPQLNLSKVERPVTAPTV